MTIRFSKPEMQKAMKTVKTSVKSGKGQPTKILVVGKHITICHHI